MESSVRPNRRYCIALRKIALDNSMLENKTEKIVPWKIGWEKSRQTAVLSEFDPGV